MVEPTEEGTPSAVVEVAPDAALRPFEIIIRYWRRWAFSFFTPPKLIEPDGTGACVLLEAESVRYAVFCGALE